jgi:hypothetical protein
MQVEDFLTKSLGAQIYTKLVCIAMGDKEMNEITKFSRGDWKSLYDESHNKDKKNGIHETQTLSHGLHSDAQGGMLRNRLVDLVNLNCMKIPTVLSKVECLMCDTIEDYIKYEQHVWTSSVKLPAKT